MRDETPPQTPHTERPVQPLRLDVERYRHHFDDMDMSEADIDAFLHSLWCILAQFVDLGFPVSAVHRYIDGLPMSAADHDGEGRP